MRVLEPHQLNSSKNRKTKRRTISYLLPLFVLFALIVGAGVIYYGKSKQTNVTSINAATTISQPEDIVDPFSVKQKPLKKLSGEQFKSLYATVVYPNTQQFADPPTITGNEAIDQRIRAKAEERGYKLTSIPMAAIIKIPNEPRLEGDDLLQPLAAASWGQMRAAARTDGYPLSLVSAYRSPEYQRDLFIQRLYANGTSYEALAAGGGDDAIAKTLEMTAVPGYSRHHTGYTIDLWCEDESTAFLRSSCFKWISANNYQKAMEYGWIPSYPEGTNLQGPEPEPWEYVWVGDAVREQ